MGKVYYDQDGHIEAIQDKVIAIIGYWGIGFPTAWFLGFQAGLGGIGIWWGLAAGLAFVATSLVIRFALRERLGLMARATRHG